MRPGYIALIVIGCIILAAGIGVGIYFGVRAALGSSSPTPTSPTTSCATGQTICSGVCCNSSTTINGKCICVDSCPVVGSYNSSVFCCHNPQYSIVVNDQCCVSSDASSCVAGTPLGA
jgi:hypothetical protein